MGAYNDLTQRDKLVQHYSRRMPKEFFQLDGWYMPGLQDDFMPPDDEGHSLTAIYTTELMRGSDVRILIPKDNDVMRSDVASMLRKAADWIERGVFDLPDDDTPSKQNIVTFTRRECPDDDLLF